jgi:uncharacterized membrane protein
MLDRFLVVITFLAAIGSGLIAGTFFAFSTFVLKALAKISAPSGIAAMQSINIVVINPLFLGVFMGTAVACVVSISGAALRWQKLGSGWLVIGALLYLVGTFAVTVVGNVPLNTSLATLSPTDPASQSQWSAYVSRWGMWNHVRTLAAMAAMGSFVAALRR